MRGKRSKQYRKLMHQYSLTFSFREPYQVLLTADIILAAHQHKMNLGNLLSSTLHSTIKPMITQCCIRHLYDLPSSPAKEACIAVAKEAERRRCGHHELEQPLSALECLESVVDPKGSGTNRHKYVVATQDLEVRQKMRTVVGVPLIYINRSVMILEPMAPVSENVKEGEEKAKVRAGLKSRRGAGEKRKREVDSDGSEEEREDARGAGLEEPAKKRKFSKGPRGPNPLSVKKARTDPHKDRHKSTGRVVEEQRSAIRKANTDPQAAEKAMSASMAAGEGTNGITEGQRKRKRKRKAKDELAGGETAGVDASRDE